MRKLILLSLPIIFLIVNLITISDYNVNWDEPVHFMRGQAYLRYLLTGKTNYDDFPGFRQFRVSLIDKTKSFDNQRRYSIYQSEHLDGSAFLNDDGGHPPLNGILAAATNVIFYQKLGLLGDVEAYHLFIILTSVALLFLVTAWSMEVSGWFAGLVSFLTLALSPMFIAESHNNIKDPVEATLFAFAIYLFYWATRHQDWKFMLGSAVLSGTALATKFNILFAPFVVLPWLACVFAPKLFTGKFKFRLSGMMVLALLSFPLIVLAIFYFSWPYLWSDPVGRTLKIINYYRQIGTGGSQPGFAFLGFNTYPIQWIFFTTPPPVIILVITGILAAIFRSGNDRLKTPVLWVFWLLVPILRVSLPGTSIYGGTRQIMEYLPAMALLAGLGANHIKELLYGYIVKLFKKTKQYSNRTIKQLEIAIKIGIILSFLSIAVKLVQLHPNQSLYFNVFIGGLPGAVKRNLPGWGTTLGNPYLQGVKWINRNAESGAKVAISMGVMTNIPFNAIRSDITYLNNIKSVHWREGEYVIGLTYSEFPVPFYDALYYERFLEPIHEIKVEGVPIVRIWKNEARYVRPGFLNETEIAVARGVKVRDGSVELELSTPSYLTKLQYFYFPSNCKDGEDAVIYTSPDGKSWKREPETLLSDQVPQVKKKITDGTITHFIPAVPARFVRIEAQEGSCLLSQPVLRLFGLADIVP